jgi:hypothetical protein
MKVCLHPLKMHLMINGESVSCLIECTCFLAPDLKTLLQNRHSRTELLGCSGLSKSSACEELVLCFLRWAPEENIFGHPNSEHLRTPGPLVSVFECCLSLTFKRVGRVRAVFEITFKRQLGKVQCYIFFYFVDFLGVFSETVAILEQLFARPMTTLKNARRVCFVFFQVLFEPLSLYLLPHWQHEKLLSV